MGFFGSPPGNKNTSASSTSEVDNINNLKQMLDNLSNIVMLADATHDNNIIYMNKRAREILSEYRNELNVALGGRADVANAMNNSIHQFHKDPDRIRRVLQAPQDLPNYAEIPLGNVVFRTRTYPIWDALDPGKLICYMACWDDISADKKMAEQNEKAQSSKLELENKVSQIATAMEEMSVSVTEVARNTNQASENAIEVASNAGKGHTIVNETVLGMQKVSQAVRESSEIISVLGKRSEKVLEIISLIDDIADKTNLLSLNAAIEAARAGEHGRGFAVVADEVRKLSDSTANATQEISEILEEIVRETGKAVDSMELGKAEVEANEELSNKAAEALDQIVGDVESIKEIVAQIATASEEQAATSNEISKNLDEIATH